MNNADAQRNVDGVSRTRLVHAGISPTSEDSRHHAKVEFMPRLPEIALRTVLKYISPSDTLSLRQTCRFARRLPMLSDARLYRSWHISEQQRSPFPLTTLPCEILEDITAYLCPSDTICLRLTCWKFSDLALPEMHELTEKDKDDILRTIEDSIKRSNVRRLLNRASMINGEIIEDWRIPAYLNEQRQTAQRRYEHDYGRANKPLSLLFCNKCGKLKAARHLAGFADGSSKLSVAVIRGRECIACHIGRFSNLRVASIYYPTVNGAMMFACFLCNQARPLEEDGLELWQTLDSEELETRLIRGVALVEHKFCKRCFENRQALPEKQDDKAIQEVNYSQLVKMMERMFPNMGKLDAESVEKEERRTAEEEQRLVQAKLQKEAAKRAETERLAHEAKIAKMEELIGSSMEDLELLDWHDGGLEDAATVIETGCSTAQPTDGVEANTHLTINTTAESSQSTTIVNSSPPSTPPPHHQPMLRSSVPAPASSTPLSPTLPNNDSDDDVFGEGFDLEDIHPAAWNSTPPTSDDIIMSDAVATKDVADEDNYGSEADMDDIETVCDGQRGVGSTDSSTPSVPAPVAVSTSEMDHLMWSGKF